MSDNQSGPIVFLGGLLLLITSILEFILGNTFPCVVFGTIGETQLISPSLSDIKKIIALNFVNRRILVCVCCLHDSIFQCCW